MAAGTNHCVLQSSLETEIAEILDSDKKFNCDADRFGGNSPRFWLRYDMTDYPHLSEKLELQSDNSPTDAVHIHALFQDGEIRTASYSKRDLAIFWRTKNRFGLSIPHSSSPLETLYVAVDKPFSKTTLKQLEIKRTAMEDRAHLLLLAMFALLSGMALVPIIYNLFFFRALKYQFMLWHCMTVLATMGFTYSSSGLMFLTWPAADLDIRTLFNYWSLAIGVWAGCMFMIHYLEPDKLDRKSRLALLVTGVSPLIGTFAVLHAHQWLKLEDQTIYFLSFLPPFLVSLTVMGIALKRGSRAAKFQCAGWIPIILFGLDRVARGAGLYDGFPILDYGLYFALILETLIIALGVADRILRLRVNYFKSLSRQSELDRLAHTDGLTGLDNRRGFEECFHRNNEDRQFDHLAVLDLDLFKDINDRYGHETGDNVLRILGRVLSDCDLYAARIGGEEFVIMLASGSGRSITRNLERISADFTETVAYRLPHIDRPLTFSAGLAPVFPNAPVHSVLALADQRLYRAKAAGRNQIFGFEEIRLVA